MLVVIDRSILWEYINVQILTLETIFIFHRIIQSLCEKGADYTLTDIEGNTPKDLAEKNGHSKCAKYLGSLMKGKLPRGASGNIAVSMSQYYFSQECYCLAKIKLICVVVAGVQLVITEGFTVN